MNFAPSPDCLLSPEEIAVEIAALDAEGLGWQPLARDAYWHASQTAEDDGAATTVEIVGLPDSQMANLNVLLLL